jgi:hypothetical protein
VNLRRTIYLTIMSALDFEEAGHKLLKMVRAAAGLENLACVIFKTLRWGRSCPLFNVECLFLISAGHPGWPGDGTGHHDY